MREGETVGNYVIERRLGAGGFGEVYRATERSPRRPVALKFLRPELAADPALLKRFQREIDAMARVEHPGVVPIYHHDRERRYFAMRYVEGGSLQDVIDKLSLEDLLAVLESVADALDHCHERNIVHRDLKPANVLVDGRRGLLTDFGIAFAADATTLTAPGQRIGTRGYMAPEEQATPASDRWSLGALAYRALTGALPGDAPIPPSRRDDRFGPEVDRVLLRALAPNPSERYDSARAFVADLRRALTAPRRRDRRWLRVAAVAVVLVPAGLYGFTALDGSAQGGECHRSYSGACLKPDSVDYDCAGGRGDGPDFIEGPVKVVGPDEYDLDRDGDGVAC